MAGHQVPTKAILSLSSSSGQGKENVVKGSWLTVRIRRDHSVSVTQSHHSVTVMGKTDLGKLVLVITN